MTVTPSGRRVETNLYLNQFNNRLLFCFNGKRKTLAACTLWFWQKLCGSTIPRRFRHPGLLTSGASPALAQRKQLAALITLYSKNAKQLHEKQQFVSIGKSSDIEGCTVPTTKFVLHPFSVQLRDITIGHQFILPTNSLCCDLFSVKSRDQFLLVSLVRCP